jgi:hypothetical protein
VVTNSRVSLFNLYKILRSNPFPCIATFADGQLTDALKHLATDSGTDPKVKKKLLSVFASWHSQFKTDPSMSLVAGLYRQHRPADRRSKQQAADADVEHLFTKMGVRAGTGGDVGVFAEKRRMEKEEKELAKRKAKEAKEKAKREEEDAKRKKNRPRRQPFDFEKVSIFCQSTVTCLRKYI